MKRQNLTRAFEYSGARLPDPDPSMDPMAVRDLFAAAGRPELSNAEVRGPEVVGNELVFTLHRAVGTKGLRASVVKKQLEQFDAAFAAVSRKRARGVKKQAKDLLNSISRASGKAMPMPSQATPWVF